jgi:hypothetical protein
LQIPNLRLQSNHLRYKYIGGREEKFMNNVVRYGVLGGVRELKNIGVFLVSLPALLSRLLHPFTTVPCHIRSVGAQEKVFVLLSNQITKAQMWNKDWVSLVLRKGLEMDNKNDDIQATSNPLYCQEAACIMGS